MSRSKHQHKKNYLGFSTKKLKKLTSRKIRTRTRSSLSKAEIDENDFVNVDKKIDYIFYI